MKNSFLIILLLSIVLVTCTKVPNGGIPTYIKLSNPTIISDKPEQGSSLNQFSDLWIESNGVNLGAYEIPITFAALLSGEQEVIINPGVQLNGSVSNRRTYPIFEPFKAIYNFVAKDTIEISPFFKYRQGVDFLYNEDFENTNNFSDMLRTDLADANNLEGKAGILTLENSVTEKRAVTINSLLINEGKRTYVEVSSKSDSYVGMGFSSTLSDNYIEIVVFKPTNEWQTTYFEITNFINQVKEGSYNFYINVQKDVKDAEENTYFDNFKIIQF